MDPSSAMVCVHYSHLLFSSAGILYNCSLQSNTSNCAKLSGESLDNLHHGGHHIMDRILDQVLAWAFLEYLVFAVDRIADSHHFADDPFMGYGDCWGILQSHNPDTQEGQSHSRNTWHISLFPSSILCGILLLVHFYPIDSR